MKSSIQRPHLRQPHLRSLSLLVVIAVLMAVVWFWVQSLRQEPLPSLVWAPNVSDEAMLGLGPPVLDKRAGGWWWIEATPMERDKLRGLGARLAVALPQPIAQMAGCNSELPADPETIRQRRLLQP
jgi:hypothetical protein